MKNAVRIISGVFVCLVFGLIAWPIYRYNRKSNKRIEQLLTVGEQELQASADAQKLLGDGLRFDGPDRVDLREEGEAGEIKLNQSVVGSSRKGLLYLEATKKNGVWIIQHLKLRPAGQSEWHDLQPVGIHIDHP